MFLQYGACSNRVLMMRNSVVRHVVRVWEWGMKKKIKDGEKDWMWKSCRSWIITPKPLNSRSDEERAFEIGGNRTNCLLRKLRLSTMKWSIGFSLGWVCAPIENRAWGLDSLYIWNLHVVSLRSSVFCFYCHEPSLTIIIYFY